MKLHLEVRERFKFINISGQFLVNSINELPDLLLSIIHENRFELLNDRFRSLVLDYDSHEIRFRYFEYSNEYVIESWKKI